MVAPAVIAAGITAGSSLLGSFLGGDKGPGFNETKNNTRTMQHQNIMGHFGSTRAAARKYGIHPSVALGINPTIQPAYQKGAPDGNNDTGRVVNEIGQGVARSVAVSQNSAQRRLADLEIENAELQNDYLKVQIAGSQRAITNHALPPPVEIVPDIQTISRKNDSGKTAGDHPAFKNWDVGRGRTVEAPWSDEGFAESLEGLPWPYTYAKMMEAFIKRKTPEKLYQNQKNAYKYIKNKFKKKNYTQHKY